HLVPDSAFDFVDRRTLLGRVADEGLQFVQEFGEVFALEDVLLVCDAHGGLLGVMGTRRQLRGDNMAVAKECLAPGGPFAYPSNNTTIIQNTTSARADDRLRPNGLQVDGGNAFHVQTPHGLTGRAYHRGWRRPGKRLYRQVCISDAKMRERLHPIFLT